MKDGMWRIATCIAMVVIGLSGCRCDTHENSRTIETKQKLESLLLCNGDVHLKQSGCFTRVLRSGYEESQFIQNTYPTLVVTEYTDKTSTTTASLAGIKTWSDVVTQKDAQFLSWSISEFSPRDGVLIRQQEYT